MSSGGVGVGVGLRACTVEKSEGDEGCTGQLLKNRTFKEKGTGGGGHTCVAKSMNEE